MTARSHSGVDGALPRCASFTAAPISRRALLTSTAFILFGFAALPTPQALAAPADDARAFLDLSRIATGRTELSPVTAQRIFEALSDDGMGAEIAHLAGFATPGQSPQALKAAAVEAGLDGELMRIIAAWYKGTVDTQKGPVVVAYRDALMYTPVADGLTVPTYCNKGPMWWSDLPPGISRMPMNSPKVL
ncbi:sorbitol dehydrogenase family protein [Mesorhizobium sp. YR577]|uniref:sorbitol dehydrogenase family protein n=1 Tax=Mesorhizobium sp. YR577 TaxID=1884373 RepID=UPI0008ECAB50|nr:sorbitol dehydrogenase family protein [Mesorhizobium sp. YR577]SFU22900.1 Membrane bound FAD containing D-sorbitol dehydrogenase [Mesorhizobium sp. YR577]